MQKDLGIEATIAEGRPKTLNPYAAEFEPHELRVKKSRWEAKGYGIYDKHFDQGDQQVAVHGDIIQYKSMDYSIEGSIIKYKGKELHVEVQPRANLNDEDNAKAAGKAEKVGGKGKAAAVEGG